MRGLKQLPREIVDLTPTAAPARSGLLRFSAAHFLALLVLLFVTAPFVQQFKGGEMVEASLSTLVLLSAVLAVGGRRRTLAVGVVLLVPALTGKWVNHFRPDVVPAEAFAAAGLLFVGFVVFQLLRFVLRAPRVNAEVLCAAIAAYLATGILWGVAYLLVAKLDPGAFVFAGGPDSNRAMTGYNAVYFSFVTLSTIGYGDIIPVHPAARMLAIVEATTGLFYIAVLISRLVALYSRMPQGTASRQEEPVHSDEESW